MTNEATKPLRRSSSFTGMRRLSFGFEFDERSAMSVDRDNHVWSEPRIHTPGRSPIPHRSVASLSGFSAASFGTVEWNPLRDDDSARKSSNVEPKNDFEFASEGDKEMLSNEFVAQASENSIASVEEDRGIPVPAPTSHDGIQINKKRYVEDSLTVPETPTSTTDRISPESQRDDSNGRPDATRQSADHCTSESSTQSAASLSARSASEKKAEYSNESAHLFAVTSNNNEIFRRSPKPTMVKTSLHQSLSQDMEFFQSHKIARQAQVLSGSEDDDNVRRTSLLRRSTEPTVSQSVLDGTADISQWPAPASSKPAKRRISMDVVSRRPRCNSGPGQVLSASEHYSSVEKTGQGSTRHRKASPLDTTGQEEWGSWSEERPSLSSWNRKYHSERMPRTINVDNDFVMSKGGEPQNPRVSPANPPENGHTQRRDANKQRQDLNQGTDHHVGAQTPVDRSNDPQKEIPYHYTPSLYPPMGPWGYPWGMDPRSGTYMGQPFQAPNAYPQSWETSQEPIRPTEPGGNPFPGTNPRTTSNSPHPMDTYPFPHAMPAPFFPYPPPYYHPHMETTPTAAKSTAMTAEEGVEGRDTQFGSPPRERHPNAQEQSAFPQFGGPAWGVPPPYMYPCFPPNFPYGYPSAENSASPHGNSTEQRDAAFSPSPHNSTFQKGTDTPQPPPMYPVPVAMVMWMTPMMFPPPPPPTVGQPGSSGTPSSPPAKESQPTMVPLQDRNLSPKPQSFRGTLPTIKSRRHLQDDDDTAEEDHADGTTPAGHDESSAKGDSNTNRSIQQTSAVKPSEGVPASSLADVHDDLVGTETVPEQNATKKKQRGLLSKMKRLLRCKGQRPQHQRLVQRRSQIRESSK